MALRSFKSKAVIPNPPCSGATSYWKCLHITGNKGFPLSSLGSLKLLLCLCPKAVPSHSSELPWNCLHRPFKAASCSSNSQSSSLKAICGHCILLNKEYTLYQNPCVGKKKSIKIRITLWLWIQNQCLLSSSHLGHQATLRRLALSLDLDSSRVCFCSLRGRVPPPSATYALVSQALWRWEVQI